MELKTHSPCIARKFGMRIGSNEKGGFQSNRQRRWATDQRPIDATRTLRQYPTAHGRNNAKYLVSATKCTYFVTLSYLMPPDKECSAWQARTEEYKDGSYHAKQIVGKKMLEIQHKSVTVSFSLIHVRLLKDTLNPNTIVAR
jgi:hypothetical protein